MSENRWTQFDEDSYRLPEGMKRIGYDADNKCYYFRDRDGQAWEGNPGEEYGTMHKLVSPPPSARAMFESDPGAPAPRTSKSNTPTPSRSFSDMLPPSAIAPPPSHSRSSSSTSGSSTDGAPLSPRARFIAAARNTALPRMRHVVRAMMLPAPDSREDEKARLLRSESVRSAATTTMEKSSH